MAQSISFPENFLWGTATCAHQVEGDNIHSDWWAYEQIPGKIRNGDRSGKACDHYHRYEEDFDLCRKINNNSHRISIEWARIEPRPGEIDNDAIDHYHKVLEALKKRSLTPFVTVHHFTLPMWFAMRGGFSVEANLRHFERYVTLLANEFGQEVEFWNTINEPAIYSTMSYLAGFFPPGETSFRLFNKVMNNILAAHALCYHALKSANDKALVGIVKNIPYFNPATPGSWGDAKAAALQDWFFNEFMLNAIATGRRKRPLGNGRILPGLEGSTDFYGLNYYNQCLCTWKNPIRPEIAAPNERATQLGWTPYPIGLQKNLLRLAKYNKPIYITENGIGTDDDTWRCSFLLEHLRQVRLAIDAGADVRGYFQWSLIDNFEWIDGYNSQFGLIGYDHKTFARQPRPSFDLYGKVAKENGIKSEWFDKYPW